MQTIPPGPSDASRIPFRIRMLRAANPLVRRLLTSRLHFLLSGDLLIAAFRGRVSGKRFATPLSYAEVDGRLYLCTRPDVANWWRNMRGGASVEITWRGRRTTARASVIESSSDEALLGFRSFLARNPGTASLLYHVKTSRGELDEADVRREVTRSVIVRLEPEPPNESMGREA